MTSPESSYVIQKLISHPSPQLQPLLSIILAYVTQLSMDSSWYRVVQSMFEFYMLFKLQDPHHPDR